MVIWKRLNNKPSVFARGIRNGKTYTIALLIESIANAFFSQIAKVMEEKTVKKGYEIILRSSKNESGKTLFIISFLKARKVDG